MGVRVQRARGRAARRCVFEYNRTIIYSAIWSSRLERETGICFNYLLVSASSVTQALLSYIKRN